jgi:integrase/recombinase XerD
MSQQRNIKTLTPPECERILDFLGKDPRAPKGARQRLRNKCAFIFLLNTGLRISEFCQLRISDLLFSGRPVNSLTVRAEIAKNRREREIPLNIQAGSVIDSMHRFLWIPEHRSPGLFAWQLAVLSKPVSPRLMQNIIKNAGMFAIGKRVTPHMLRHTFATRAIKKADSRVVQKLLGHSSLATTQIYTHPDNDDLRKAIEQIN